MTEYGYRLTIRSVRIAILIILSVSGLILNATAVRAQPHSSSTGPVRISTGYTHVSTALSPGKAQLPSPRLAGSSPAASTTATPSPSQPVRIAIDAFTQIASMQIPPKVTGRLELTDSAQVSSLEVRVDLGRPLSSRSDLANLRDSTAAAAAASYPTPVVAQPIANPLIPGAPPVTFTASASPATLNLPAALRVYPVRIAASGTVNGQRRIVATAYTFLVWAPLNVTAPTPISVVLPLADVPRLRADGRLSDDGLTDLIAPGGRLDMLLNAVVPARGEQTSTVTLAVDPVLVQTLKIIADGPYEVATPSGPSPRRPDRNATIFLAKLRAFADAGGTVVALPYGDVDVVALARAQEYHSILVALLTGQTVVANAIGRPPDTTIAYPSGGLIDQTTLDLLRRMGITTVITDSRLLPPKEPDRGYTPAAITNIATSGGVAHALAADTELARLATGPTALPDSPTQAESFQDLVAEIAMITAERPGLARAQTLALPRYWDPPADWAQKVLGGLSTPFSRPVPLAWTPPAGPAAANGERGPLGYPAWARAAELPASRMIAAEDLRSQVQSLKSVLCPPGSGPSGIRNCVAAGIDAMENTLTATESVAWRAGAAGTDGADTLSAGVAGAVRALRDGVRIVASRSVSLTSKHGKVPVTLENNTTFTVSVVLSLASTDHSRLRSASKLALTVPPLQKEQVEVDVNAEGAGTFPVNIQILTPAGRPLSADPPLRVLVKSTVFGVIAVAITGGSLAVLVLAVAIRLVQRLRVLRRQPPGGPPPPAAPVPAAAAAAARPASVSGSRSLPMPGSPDDPDSGDDPDTLECARRLLPDAAGRDPRASEREESAHRNDEYRNDDLERLIRATNTVRRQATVRKQGTTRNEGARW
ncbi:DUF6049 family protein [Frankia sp. Cj3]|uniref:DUF6049 family protein n=1 Tax=Frankia sp. Cj3 TaxID=2880976 RepID=UPI001EF54DCC|nr:DUF6049 family protein [Frankia sp. Cj3]